MKKSRHPAPSKRARPQRAGHAEPLHALQGPWEITALHVDGQPMPEAMIAGARVHIDGDRFRSEAMGAIYEGVLSIDTAAEPHAIDFHFDKGPEAGNTNHGIFSIDADQFSLCMDMTGKGRPSAFKSVAGSGHAFEILRRVSALRPAASAKPTRPAAAPPAPARAGFDYVPSPTLTRLQGEWSAVKLIKDGQELLQPLHVEGHRTATKNEIKVTYGGQLILHALVKVDEHTTPVHVDYYNLTGRSKGKIQHGILQWLGDDAAFCMAAPGAPRPNNFDCPANSGHTLSQWRPAKLPAKSKRPRRPAFR